MAEDDYINYQTTTFWRVNKNTGNVEHVKGWTNPVYGDFGKKKKKRPQKKINITLRENLEEVEL